MSMARRLQRPLTCLAVGAVTLALAGCAVGPNFHRPAPPPAMRYVPDGVTAETAAADVRGGEAQRFVADLDISGQWWTLFHSPALNALIARSLQYNADLAAARAALRAAEETHKAQLGSFYPSVEGNFTASRNQNAQELAPTLSNNELRFNLYTAQLTISYALDVFGGLRRQAETTRAEAEAQRFQLEATYLTLTSNVVAAAVQEASLRGQIAATEKIVDEERETLGIMRKQEDKGEIAQGDVIAQETTLAQAEANLPPLTKQLGQERDLIAALTGQLPSEEPAETFRLADLALPQELPLSLPSKLVDQRPDVRAAEANLHAASAQVGVAIANMLPQITLTATPGTVATDPALLFASGNYFWAIAGGVTQPIFEGGALLHKTRAARAALDQALAQYRGTVIAAFQNVADTLRALQGDAAAVRANLVAEETAAQSLEIARQRLRLGDVSYLTLLSAEQAYQQAVAALVQAQASRYADTAALFQALGGGWWNRTDAAVAAAP